MRMNDVLGCFLSLAQWMTGWSAAATFQATLIKANVQHQKEVQENLTFSVSLFITNPDPLNRFHRNHLTQSMRSDIIFSLHMHVSYSHFFSIDQLFPLFHYSFMCPFFSSLISPFLQLMKIYSFNKILSAYYVLNIVLGVECINISSA